MHKCIILMTCIIFFASCSLSSTKPKNTKDRTVIATDLQLPEGMALVGEMPEPYCPFSYDDYLSYEKNFFSFRNDIAIYCNSKNELVCFDVKQNKIRWKSKNRYPVNMIMDHTSQEFIMIVAKDENDIFHFHEPETGKQRFMLNYNPSNILYADKKRIIYQEGYEGEINCISSLYGTNLWSFKTPGFSQAPGVSNVIVAKHDSKVIIAEWHSNKEPGVESRNIYLFEFDMDNGKLIKIIKDGSENYDKNVSYFVLEDESKIIINDKLDEKNNELYLYDLKTGQKVWSIRNVHLVEQDKPSKIAVVESDGKLSKLNIDKGTLDWSYKFVGLYPSIVSIDESVISFNTVDDPEKTEFEPTIPYLPNIMYNKRIWIELDCKTGVELKKYICYSEGKISENLRGVTETIINNNITVIEKYNLVCDRYGYRNKENNATLTITNNETKSVIEQKMPEINKICIADSSTVVALTKKEIYAFRDGKQIWWIKRSMNNDNPEFHISAKGDFLLYGICNENSVSSVTQIDKKTGEIRSILECNLFLTTVYQNDNKLTHSKSKYCFSRNKDWLRIFRLPNLE